MRLVELTDQVTTEAIQHQAKQAILQELTIAAQGQSAMSFAQQEALKHKDTRTAEEMVPKQYHKFLTVFDKKAAECFPPSHPYDHAINLKPGFTPRAGKVYSLPVTEQKLQDEFLDSNLRKGYIRPSQSPESAPLFFTGKKDGSARSVQDYRRINEWTVKNAYPSPLTKELMDKLQKAKYFTKLDLRSGYNNIHIKDGDQWKAAFVTNRGLFEPMVMFFGLYNSPATFQAFMDDIFHHEIIGNIVIIYMDDILIFAETRDELRS